MVPALSRIVLFDGMDHEPVHAETPEYIRQIRELFPDADVKHASLAEISRDVAPYRDELPVREGELNETAEREGPYLHLITHTLSSRYPIKRANDECQILLEKWADPLSALALLCGCPVQPAYMDLAYRYLLQNHPHDSICGCSIDQVHKDMEYRFDQALQLGREVVNACLARLRPLSLRTVQAEGHDRIVRLWNPLAFARKETIRVDIDFEPNYPAQYQEPFGYEARNSFRIFDSHGTEIPYGLTSVRRNVPCRVADQGMTRVDRHTVVFEAELAPMGTVDYRIVPYKGASRYLQTMTRSEREAENERIRLRIADNGTWTLEDKRNSRHYEGLGFYWMTGRSATAGTM